MAIDKDLAGALKTAKTKSMHFALVEKAPGEGTLIVSKNPVPQGAIAEAKKDLGGGKIYIGQCATDATTGELIFEGDGAEPPMRTLKAVITRDAGMTLKLNTRKAKAGVTIDDVMGAIRSDEAAQAQKRLDDIVKGRAYQAAKSQRGLVADALDKLTVKAQRLIDQKAYPQAAKAMDDLKAFADQPTQSM